MPRFREQKTRLKALLAKADWMRELEGIITDPDSAREVLNPLLALLPRPELRWQAAYGLGLAVPRMAEDSMERARVVMRRFMWSLNEESGNLGWGIPEAMACILADSPALAREYARIFFSYGYETGGDDNFIDHAPLRRGVYWGMGRIAQKNPEEGLAALPHLTAALGDSDRVIRAFAAWALACLAKGAQRLERKPEKETWREAQRALAQALEREDATAERVELFDGRAIISASVRGIYLEAGKALAESAGSAGESPLP